MWRGQQEHKQEADAEEGEGAQMRRMSPVLLRSLFSLFLWPTFNRLSAGACGIPIRPLWSAHVPPGCAPTSKS